ncbi:MAG: site-specific integrase [Rikenellaceae bacterium]
MASIKVKFRKSKLENKEGGIYYQIIQNRIVRQIHTEYKIFPTEWDGEGMCVSIPSHETNRNKKLIEIKEGIKLDVNRLNHIITSLNKKSVTYTAEDIVQHFKNTSQGPTIFKFMQEVISRLKELHKARLVETYTTTLNKFMRFRGGKDVLLTEYNSDLMVAFEAYLKYENATINTISFYMRTLRAVYNRAVEQELISQRYPFKHVYTGVDKTIKRALPLKQIKQIKQIELLKFPRVEFARDMFLFSFYTRGMSFVDMAYLRKKDLQNGVLTYRRRKTGQQLHIKWEKCMQDILSRYPVNKTQYLLPIITQSDVNERLFYQKILTKTNYQLKELAKILNLNIPLTMYVARHSWASVAKNKNVPISVISEGMGHDSEATTQIYLASLDNVIIDKANKMIIKLLL